MDKTQRDIINLPKIFDPRGNLTVAEKETYHLNHPWQGLLVETEVWRTLDDFSSGAVCLVLASDPFEETDYIRSYDQFIEYIKEH